MTWLLLSWAWLRKWGGWVAAGVASLLAFVFYASWRKTKDELPSGPDANDVKKQEDARAKVEIDQAVKAEAEAAKQAHDNATRDWDRVVDTTRTHTDEIKDSPGAIDVFLDHTGDNMRK